jgi:site-specific recombinase XerD
MQEKESILTITRCISIVIQIRKQIDKPLSKFTKEDIKAIFQWMDNKKYKVETIEKYRAVIKKFYKMVYGSNDYYPDCVKWFAVKVGKDKHSKERGLDIAEYLEEEEVPILIENTPTLQKRAFLACLYESGSRPEEFLRLSNLDCKIDTNGAILILRGKTGEIRIRIVSFAKLLQQWLDIHPLKHKKTISFMNKPGMAKPILMLHGEQGSAKTTLQELIKTLVYPSIVKTLTFPRDINELVQQLSHN